MKKNFRKIVVSIALSLSMCCTLFGVACMGIFKPIRTVAEPVVLSGFTLDEGAAVRKSNPNGIRFTTYFNKAAKTAAEELSDVTYGTLLLPGDLLGSEELTLETDKVVNLEISKWKDDYTYQSVLTGTKNPDGSYNNLPESYYNRPIAARSYVQGVRGNELVTYYSENTTIRSIGYVAYMADLDGDTSALVETIAGKAKIELAFNEDEQISAVQSAVSGAAIVENKFDVETDNAAVIKIAGIVPSAEVLAQYNASLSYSSNDTGVVSVNGTTLAAESQGQADVTVNGSFNGITLDTITKTMSTDVYKLQSNYKILISETAANGPLNSQTTYLPAQSVEAHNAYCIAFEKTAAYKLQEILKEATGVQLDIVTNVESGYKYISVGETSLGGVAKLSAATKAKDTAYEVNVDASGNVIICGTTQRGTLYGVQELLGDLVGYEYFMEETYKVDNCFEVVLDAAKSYSKIPDMEYNVLQGDLQMVGAMDEYSMQMYTEGIVPIGTTDWEDANGHYYKGIAHNSLIVLNDGTYSGTTSYSNSKAWKKWYATNSFQTSYKTTTNPYYSGTDNPNTSPNEGVATMLTELCYTAHGDSTVKTQMITKIVDAMYAKMVKFPAYNRVGFAHMDHRVWCECSSCKNQGNAADNLLEFLLDVAAALKTKLANAGDARAETFKISSLFYHASCQVPGKTANYTAKLQSYMKHVEPWFAESGADHIDPYELTEDEKSEIHDNNYTTTTTWHGSSTEYNNWNATAYTSLVGWSELCSTYGADMLFWAYYANTTSFFIPFNTFEAIRRNYGTFSRLGIDYTFNQMMESKQNFARFKEFLISKLAWNANPSGTEWETWYTQYFNGAYGSGATAMRNYFNQWSTWADNNVNEFRRNTEWDSTDTGSSSMGIDAREWTDLLTAATLEAWIDAINDALDALDVSDPKYDIYRKNIMLEKLTPMYLLMWMHDGYEPVMQSNGYLIDATQEGEFASATYVNKYGSEFLTWVEELKLSYDGEGSTRTLAPFISAINTVGVQGGTVVTNKHVAERQYLDVSENATFSNTVLSNGTYTVSGAVSGSAKALAGETTLDTSALTAGQAYSIVFTNDATGSTTTFSDVLAVNKLSATAGAVIGSNGYYYIDKTYFVEDGETQLWLKHNVLQKGTYTVTANGEGLTASTYVAGQLKISVGSMTNGQEGLAICVDENNNTFVFKVISAKFIRTAQELQALGVGGKTGTYTYNDEERPFGNGNSNMFGNDVTGYYALANDIDCAGVVFAAGYSYGDAEGASHFTATIDGNGYVLSNVSVNEGGIFGGMLNATVQNMTFCDVVYADNLGNYAGNWSNYTALFAQKATNTTFKNIEINVKEAIHNSSSWVLLDGMMVASMQDKVQYANITINAQGLDLVTVLGSHIDLETVEYGNFVVKANSYVAVGYTDDEFNPEDTAQQNTEALLGEFPEGVSFIKTSKRFEILNEETTLGLGNTLTISTSQPSYNYNYYLLNQTSGVTVDGNTVSVAMSATVGGAFTVLVEETSEGFTQAITFAITKGVRSLVDVPTIETIKDTSFKLPSGVNAEDIKTITAGGYVYYDAAKGIGSIVDGVVIPDAIPVEQQYLGRGLTLTIETEMIDYVGEMNVYTMIIDNKEELNQWQEVSAQHAVDTGLCIAEQKGITYSGYFVLGADIEYNDTWTPYKAYGALWGLCYQNNAIWTGGANNSGSLVEGAFQEDWGRGELGGFKGVFDGNGHSIIGMRTSGEYSGFIVTMGGGTVKDVAFTNASIGAGASLIANRGSGAYENIYVQLAAMESGAAGKSTTVLVYMHNTHASTAGMTNVLVDVSAIDYASLTYAFIANLATVNNNIYVVGMPEGITLSVQAEQEAPVVFLHCNTNAGNTSDYDVAGGFVNVEALLADETHGAVVKAWDSAYWTIDEEENLVLPINIYNDLMAVELPDVVDISIKDGTFTLPNSISGTVTSVVYNDVDVFTSVSGNVVTFDKAAMPTDVDQLGENRGLVIRTATTTYILKANVYTDIITTAEELQALGVGGRTVDGNGYTDLTGYDVYGYYALGNNIDCTGLYMAAGYTGQQSWFYGTFDGRGYTVSNVIVSEGGIFGGMKNATIRNVNFTNVRYHDNSKAGQGYNGNKQWGQYFGLLGQIANNITVENINVHVAEISTPNFAMGLLVFRPYSGSVNTFRNINVDASGLSFENVLTTHTNDGTINYENVTIKATGYSTIALVGEKGSEAITEWPAGVTFKTDKIEGRPTTNKGEEIATYTGDVTAFGFAADANVFEITTTNSWSDRIIFPASTEYDYVEFDIYLTADLVYLTAWPARDGSTQGDMQVYARSGMNTSNGLVRTIQVFDANGNGLSANSFTANTLYTVRVGFNDNEAVELNQLQIGPHANQTYYVSAARFGDYSDTEMRIYDASRNVLPYYDGDVTAVGYMANAKVTAATMTDGWSHRVRVNGDLNFDYVDLQFSVNRTGVTYFTLWMYGVDGAMMTGSYGVSTTNVTPSGDAPIQNKKIEYFDANGYGTSVASFAVNTVYTIRVYLDGATGFDIATFNASAGNPVTVYFGGISYGNVTDLDETVQIEVENGSFAVPLTIEGTVKSVKLEGTEILSSVADGKVTINGSAVQAFGQEKSLFIETTVGTYSLYADVATKFITTADELKALGVGGNRTNTADITGYYALANDIGFEHADDYSDLVTAGYPANGAYYFKGTFDGFGHTLYNMRVSDGGIFGLMRGGTVKNLNLINVYMVDNPPAGVSTQNGGYISILAFSAPSSVFENINITIASSSSAWSWKRDGLLVNSGSWGASTYRNITVDASGLKLKTLLGISHNSNNVYENVEITAADYVAIGYTGDSYKDGVQNTETLMSEFPAGVTFKQESDRKNIYYEKTSAVLPVYAGDVTALGFPKGTIVYESVQDNRTNMWAAGTNLGLTMEQQKVMIHKSVDADYASVQFSLSREFTGNHAFFTWWFDANGQNQSGGGYLTTAGAYQASGTTMPNPNAVAYDMNGMKATSFKANTVYELRWYGEGATAFGLACCEQNGEHITIYYANPSSGNSNPVTPGNTSTSKLGVYMGDVTAVGFAEGTDVYYEVQDNRTSMWSPGTNYGLTMEQQGVMLTKAADEDYASIQFSVSREFAGNYAFFTWWFDANGKNQGGGGYLLADGSYIEGGTTMTNPYAIAYDMNGNAVTSFQANTVYELRWYGEGATMFKLACCEQNGEHITVYYANPSSGNEA